MYRVCIGLNNGPGVIVAVGFFVFPFGAVFGYKYKAFGLMLGY